MSLHAQVLPGSITLGGNLGPAIYIGEFNSLEPDNSFHLRFGIDGDLNLRYHVDEHWSVGALIGLARLNFSIDDAVRTKYASNFFGPVGDPTFASSSVAFTEDYQIAVTRYGLFGQFRPLPMGRAIPYLSLGLEGFSFQAFNDSGVELPETLTGTVDHRSLALPLGAGVEYVISPWLTGVLQGTFYIPFTDYLDGYAHYLSFETTPGIPGPGSGGTLNDHLFSLRVGLSAIIYRPSQRPPEEPPPPAAERSAPPSSPSSPSTTPPGSPGTSTPSGTDASPVPRAGTPSEQDTGSASAQPPVRAIPTPPPAQTPRPTLDDTDGDGLSDADETGRYMTDPGRRDTDGDNVGDRDELFRFNTSPNNPDTDDDGLLDGQEVYVYKTNPLIRDTDRDGLTDGEEVLRHVTDPLKADSDDDGLFDRTEVDRGSSPITRDTDNDGVADKDDACPTSFGPAANGGCPNQ